MKRWIPLCVAFLFGGVVLLSRTAISYEDFTGTWYSCSSGEGYLFSQGIIVCQENAREEAWAMDGAYSVSRDSLFLFARGVEGLETERVVYLIHRSEGDLLCEKHDGTGAVYFTRTPSEK